MMKDIKGGKELATLQESTPLLSAVDNVDNSKDELTHIPHNSQFTPRFLETLSFLYEKQSHRMACIRFKQVQLIHLPPRSLNREIDLIYIVSANCEVFSLLAYLLWFYFIRLNLYNIFNRAIQDCA